MDNQTPQSATVNPNPPVQNQPVQPVQQVNQKPPRPFFLNKAFWFVIITLLIFAGCGTYFVLNSKSKSTPVISQAVPATTPTPFLTESTTDIFRKGFYINRDLKFSFNYPASWSLGEKTIDRKGNLNNLTFYFENSETAGLGQIKFLTISVTKGNGENFSDTVSQLPGIKKEMKKIGDLNGDFYSINDERSKSYWAVFITTLNNLKYGFVLSVPLEKKEEYLAKFEELISSVQINDLRALSLPEYFRDNLPMDRRISQPSYLPNSFSITYEKQQGDTQEWNYSVDVTELSSGPNNLNIYVQKIGTQQVNGSRKFVVNLENVLEAKSGSKNASAGVEAIEVKGLKGYLTNGHLIFATDKVVVSIDYIEFSDVQVFNKQELLKIAESMVHL